MTVLQWTATLVGLSFALYIGIAIWSRARSTSEFYVAGKGVHPLANGMATAADWMSAASFISMAGIISFLGYDGSVYLMGWTGGYVLLALLLAPYLRKFGAFTVPDFVGERYYSQTARVVAVICAIFVSFTYVAGQMRGVGIVFSRFLEIDIALGVVIGMGIVFFYAVLGGMKGITYTQVAQYCVLIFAYTVPAIFLSMLITGIPIPQIGLGAAEQETGTYPARPAERPASRNWASRPTRTAPSRCSTCWRSRPRSWWGRRGCRTSSSGSTRCRGCGTRGSAWAGRWCSSRSCTRRRRLLRCSRGRTC